MNTRQKTSGKIEFTLGNSVAPLPGPRSKDLRKNANTKETEKKKVGTENESGKKKGKSST